MEISHYIRSGLALAIVISLIFLIFALLRKFNFGRFAGAAPGAKRRLSLQDMLILDDKRRIVIVKCDSKEHVILLSQGCDLLIDSCEVNKCEN